MKKLWIGLPLAALVLGGCNKLPSASQVGQQAQQAAEQKAAEQVVRANCKFDKDVCDYFVAQGKMLSQPVKMTTTTAIKGQTTQGTATVTSMDGKGNMDSVTSQNGKEQAHVIIFNNATYTKDNSDSKWFKMSSGDSNDNSVFNMKDMIEEMKDTFSEDNTKLTVTKVGQEACGGLTCVIYEMVDEVNKEFGKTKVWIDTKDHYARKMEITSDMGTTQIAYSYEAVTITEPSPVKEFSVPKLDGVPGGGQMPSQEDVKKLMEQFGQNAPTGEGE